MIRKIIKFKNEYLRRLFLNKHTLKLFDHKYTVYYQKKNDDLSKLCRKYITNKGYELSQLEDKNFQLGYFQNYSDYYSEIFSLKRKYVENLLELGIGSVDKTNLYNMRMLGNNYQPGASLKVWKEYFYNANIFGADIDKNTLINEERIKTSYVDQSNKKSIYDMFENFNVKEFDIIIDDGCHRFVETIIFFNVAITKLKKDGIYIIEDIAPSQRKKFLEYFSNSDFKIKIINFYRPKENISSNCIITIRK